MLRRSVIAIIACAAALSISGCGVKGPLRLPPGQTAPAPTGLPPGAVPATTTSDDRTTETQPSPSTPSPAPDENKDRTE